MNLVCELYLDLATALLRAGDPEAAYHELVECIDLVTLGEGPTAIHGPDPFWRILRAQAQLVDNAGDSYKALRLAEGALFHAQRVRSRFGTARVQQLLAQLCEKAGLGGKAARRDAISAQVGASVPFFYRWWLPSQGSAAVRVDAWLDDLGPAASVE